MDKLVRRIALGVAIVVSIFGLYLIIEFIRLTGADDVTKPLITISEEITDDRVKYDGLGFEVVYKIGNSDRCYGEEVWLFGKILVWAWIE